jgi:solute:Na+ symporter, SSS family
MLASAFRPADVVVLVLYLLGMLAVGFYFSRRNKSTEEYFVGGRSFPGWLIGISMLGTSISSMTFLAFPADAYQQDWRQLVFNLMLPFVAVIAVVVFIPFFRRGNLTSAFEYLGDRYGIEVRLYGTLSFLILQLIRISNILLLVSIPVHFLTGLDLQLVIVGVGIFIAVYTVVGGIDAVIWTDVVQAFVLWFGGALCLGYIVLQLPGGFSQILEVAGESDKFSLGEMELDWTRKTFYTVAVLGIFQWLAMYTSDQTFVQRYVAASSLKEARKAAILYTCCALPTWIFFFFLGTSLFVYFQVFPDPEVAALDADEVFPKFILTRIPAGLAGLVIAGVLAAAMSSLDSSLNSMATIITVDILKPLALPGRSDADYLRIARWIATLAAGLMITGALVVNAVPRESVNTVNLIASSIFGGCLVGLFLLGFFTLRVDRLAATVAMGVAILANLYLGFSFAGWLIPEAYRPPIHEFWVGMVVNAVFVAVAYGLGVLRNPRAERQKERLGGLTVWTTK